MLRNRERAREEGKYNEAKWIGECCGKHGSYEFYKAFTYNTNVLERDVPSKALSTFETKEKILSAQGQIEKRILAVGDFFFLKFHKEDPICIGEIQLLWNDKVADQDLTSTRLYYIPETTPPGRKPHHGKDEVLAASEKIVMLTSDLISLIVEPKEWNYGMKFVKRQNSQVLGLPAIQRNDRLFNGIDMQEIDQAKAMYSQFNGREKQTSNASIRVLSLQSYNRYKAMIKRFEGMSEDWMRVHEPLLVALGLHTSSNERARIVFSQSTFEYPLLLEHEYVRDELGPVFKGRPRKKVKRSSSSCKKLNDKTMLSDVRRSSTRQKSKRKKTYEMYNLEDYIPSKKPRISSQSKARLATKGKLQSEPRSNNSKDGTKKSKNSKKSDSVEREPLKLIIKRDFMKDNFHTLRNDPQEMDARHSETSLSEAEFSPQSSCSSISNVSENCEGSEAEASVSSSDSSRISPVTVPSPKTPSDTGLLPMDEDTFCPKLFQFMKERNTPIGKIPSLGYKRLDLWEFFKLSQEYGGYEMVTIKRLWKHIYDRMGGNPSRTSAATTTRKQYQKLLLPFEKYVKSFIESNGLNKQNPQPSININCSTNGIQHDANRGPKTGTDIPQIHMETSDRTAYAKLDQDSDAQDVDSGIQSFSNDISPLKTHVISTKGACIPSNDIHTTETNEPSRPPPLIAMATGQVISGQTGNDQHLRSSVIKKSPAVARNLGRRSIPTNLHGSRYSTFPPPHVPRREKTETKNSTSTKKSGGEHVHNKHNVPSLIQEKDRVKKDRMVNKSVVQSPTMNYVNQKPVRSTFPHMNRNINHDLDTRNNSRGASQSGNSNWKVKGNSTRNIGVHSSNFHERKNSQHTRSPRELPQDVARGPKNIQSVAPPVIDERHHFPNSIFSPVLKTPADFIDLGGRSQKGANNSSPRSSSNHNMNGVVDENVFKMFYPNVPNHKPQEFISSSLSQRPNANTAVTKDPFRPEFHGLPQGYPAFKSMEELSHLNLGLLPPPGYPNPLTNFYHSLASGMRGYPYFPGVPRTTGREMKMNYDMRMPDTST